MESRDDAAELHIPLLRADGGIESPFSFTPVSPANNSPHIQAAEFTSEDNHTDITEEPETSPQRENPGRGARGAVHANRSFKASPGHGLPRSNSNSKNNVSVRETRARRTTWLCIDDTGQKSLLNADKRTLIQKFKLGVPIRDMRLVDPSLGSSDSGKVLVRDNAIVFSLEHVRLLITANLVIIPQAGYEFSPVNSRFIHILEEAIVDWASDLRAENTVNDSASDDEGAVFQHQVPPLPFELLVMEVALKEVCQLCTRLVKELEAVAHPALDTLTKQVSTPNLERVRKVKTRHQRLLTRVTTTREELERFLDDDDDMAKMCLTRKSEAERLAARSYSGSGSVLPPIAPSFSFLGVRSVQRSLSSSLRMQQPPASPRASGEFAFQPQEGGSAEEAADAEALDAVENLLESYFMQIDGTYDSVVSLGEYIKDTEEYINIELDSSRNQLIKLEIVLTAATFAIAMYSMVAGILGENLIIPDAITRDVGGFVLVNAIMLLLCVAIFYGIMAYIRYRRLL